MDKKKATQKRSPKTKKSPKHIITSKQHIIIVDALRVHIPLQDEHPLQ